MDTKTIRIIQTVHVSHNETVARSWYDVVERTFERTIDTDGSIVADELVDEQVIEEALDHEEEIVASDEDTEPDEIVGEEFEEDDE
jgi:hypothetical protein